MSNAQEDSTSQCPATFSRFCLKCVNLLKSYTRLCLSTLVWQRKEMEDAYLRLKRIPQDHDTCSPLKIWSKAQNFGEPFSLVICEGETLAGVKMRIQKKLQVSDEEFLKWKFALLSLGRPDYLLDSDVVSSRFQRRDVYGAWKQYFGLEQPNNTPKELCCKL
ncbi:ubiquitin C-terminal hydrolase 13-like isoform X2 [Daucus carota subsp. sativus]|uniref:ubiquitin C-terminal hydrolase 13-like isoform X2 n=1 Tax=Daucus carota subsp. sativus TaxID=79200 RepID=UPI0007EF2A49|nr:PREDICTED: ubiquitin carboxyl-terminal hydrolase 13-like isoform X2 [Daucus carota subsp. sativus]